MKLFAFRTLCASIALACAAGAPAGAATPDALAVREVDASPVGRYLVTFDEAGLAAYTGGVPGYARTAPFDVPFARHALDADSAPSRAYLDHLKSRRAAHVAAIEAALGRGVAVAYEYAVTENGVSVALSPGEAQIVAGLPHVARVAPVRVHPLSSYRGPAFIGADRIWNGTSLPFGASATRGQGMRVGIIDSGVDRAHPSFGNDAACGFSAAAPKLVARDCVANDGVRCTGSNPAPDTGVGHGMHVASTAAGNAIDGSAVPAPMLPAGWAMSGVAPCAQVVSYKACIATGCYDDMLRSAVQNVIADAVDVVNYSIGPRCGGGDPWNDSAHFLAAATSGIAVVAAAGNTGAECAVPTGLVANLGPWVTTVAASTHDRFLGPLLTVTGPGEPSPLLSDMILTPGSATLPPPQTIDRPRAPLRLYADNPGACTADGGIPAGYFNGSIAIVRRGGCNFGEKIANAAAAGADATIVVNNVDTNFTMATDGAPAGATAYSISSLAIADALVAFVGAHVDAPGPADRVFADGLEPAAGARGDYRRQGLTARQGDVIGSFSLRGPVPAPLEDLAKPDVSAPGVDIYAATDPASGDYEILSGTSMASPHVTGATALLRALHPSWSAGEVKSALMTTAVPGTRENGATPWTSEDVGSGRIDVAAAALAGLTFDETDANYRAANPSGGTLPIKALNLASLRDMQCGESCTFTRTVRNRLDATGTWTVEFDQPAQYRLTATPSTFTLAPGQTQTLAFEAEIVDVTQPGALSFGSVRLREKEGRSPVQHLPVAVRGSAVSVDCAGGWCNFRIDAFSAGYSAIGCEPRCNFLWANRFSPPASAYPITLTSATFLTGSPSYVAQGDRYDVYVYQDDDRDPSNGATLAGSFKNYVVSTAGARLRTVTFAPPIVLNGPGDVMVALASPTGTGPRPATGELSVFRRRSYVGDYAGEDPNLATANLRLNPEAIGSNANWVIRALGTTAGGQAIELGGEAPVER